MRIWLTAQFFASASVLSHAQTGAPTRPQHAILLVIDGLSYLSIK